MITVKDTVYGQNLPWSERMAIRAMELPLPDRWHYERAVICKGIESVYKKTNEDKYLSFIKNMVNAFVDAEGKIHDSYKPLNYNIDNILPGRNILFLYQQTDLKERYKEAARILREQLEDHPRTSEGGFWHKQIYPHQMWLDGLYMGQPFYAEYATLFNEPEIYDDVAKQFILMEKYARDNESGLLYHGWDESREQEWADPVTGRSPHVWGRAMGWYAMALVDVLDYIPAEHSKRDSLVQILERLAMALSSYQHPDSGVWYQVVDSLNSIGNYPESSASCMFVYALAKGARMGLIDASYMDVAVKGYQGILDNFIETDINGKINLTNVCAVAGLGGNPYRNGSYEYYIGELVVKNDPKGVGAFILASAEIEMSGSFPTAIYREQSSGSHYSIFPNPFEDQLSIHPMLNGDFSYTILDLSGRQVVSDIKKNIYLSHLEPGIYFIHIKDQTGSHVKKLVKLAP